MPPTHDLSFTSLDEFVNKPKVENYKAKSSKEETKVVRKNDDALIIEEYMSDNEEEDVSQPKIEKKTVRPSIAKIEFVKSKQQEKTARKTVNAARSMSCLSKIAHETIKRPIHKNTSLKNSKVNQKDHGMIDNGCSRHMTWNMSYLTNYEEIDGGYVAFGGNPKGEKITGKGSGPYWLFDIDALTRTMNYDIIVAGTQSNGFVGTKASDNAGQARKETKPVKDYILLLLWTIDPPFFQDLKGSHDDGSKPSNEDGKKVDEDQKINVKINRRKIILTTLTIIFNFSSDNEDDGTMADIKNLDTTIQVSPIPTTRIHKDHPLDQVIKDLHSTTQTRNMSKNLEEHGFVSTIYQRTNHKDLQNYLFACFLSQEEPKKTLVDLLNGKRAIGTKWVFRNKKDERGIVIRNKARLVAQGHTQEEWIDYDEVFTSVARIKAIRLFLAYASFKDFVVYQMDVKSDFLYGKIEEEVYVCQPPGFEDPDFPDKVYKVEKALYGLHQPPRAWYETLSTYLLDNGFHRGKMDKTLFIRRHKGLQVKQKQDGIFISQDKYVTEILKKYGFIEVKNASTPMETQKPLLKDEDAGSESRPPMLNKENYVPWSSRLLRYAKSRPNGMLIHNSILNGPYIKADDQAIQTILLGLPEDIYAAVDSCETAQEIWLRVQQMMKGSDIGIQEKNAKLFNEWERFTSNEGESIESYYHRFLKLMNDLKRNKHFPEKIASNLKFLNNLQPEWSQHKEVDQLKAERLAKIQDPLALMANSNNPYASPAPHQDQSPFNQNYMQQPIPNPEDITDPTTAMNMTLALMAKAFKLNYSTPTNNNQRISSNPRNRQIAQPGMNMGQDRQMQMIGGNGGNQFRQYAGQSTGNLNGYNEVQNVRNQVAPNPRVQNVGNQNGLIGVQGNGIQNQIGNGNLVAICAEGNAAGQNKNQIRC
uniref:Reverse transcriptase Ty1/copia-type domain-containing protein n=1 Tax=Tanacetum cinerariifolium TaxID=118510 RepID=A0A6L2KFS2_TANCI|nr:hypothetical protein [Tanacetum cinerariifolium]